MNDSRIGTSQSRKKTYMLLAVLALIALVGLVVFNKEKAKSEKQPQSSFVRIYTLEENNDRQHFQLTGVVHARVESNLGFRVPGKIVKKLVDQGQYVKKDQPLMILDAVDLQLTQKAAQDVVLAVKAENIRALQDEERQRALVKEQAVSNQDYELAKAKADATTAKLREAEANARQAENQVQYAVLRADADGVIMDVIADVGQVVSVGQTVISLAQNDSREAVVYLPETAIFYARDAKEATLYLDPTKSFGVDLRELSVTADPATRTYQARYTLKGEFQSAPLGSTVTVSFVRAKNGDVKRYRVPIGALYDNGSGSGVWIINQSNSTVHLRPITILELGEEFASVTGDLAPGEKIAALGVHLLKSGEKVRFDNTNKTDAQ